MSYVKRSRTIEQFFSKKPEPNNDASHLIHLQGDDPDNLNILTRNSQATTTSNDSIDTCVILCCIEDIVLIIENGDGDTFLSGTESKSSEKDILLDIGSDLRHIKRITEECGDLIQRTTEIDSLREKVLHDILEFKGISSINDNVNNVLTRIQSIKRNILYLMFMLLKTMRGGKKAFHVKH